MPDFYSLKASYRRYALYERGHRPQTVNQTISILTRLCEWEKNSEIQNLTTPIVRNFLQLQREKLGWSAKTFRLYRQYMKTFFQWAVDEQWVTENPVLAIKQPRLPERLPRCLTKEQALRAFTYVHWFSWHTELERPRNEAIYGSILYAGLRLSEVINLKVTDVNLESGELYIRAGKNEKDRTIPIAQELKPILIAYKQARKRLGKPSIWFFPSVKSDKRLAPKNIQIFFQRVSKASGVKVTPHMLRHTFGRLCVENGINLRVIQNMMGHKSIQTTQIYTFVSTQAAQKAMADFRLF